MTARVLDEARAFEIIAPHLNDDRRKAVAEVIAARLEGAPARAAVRESFAERPAYDLSKSDPVVEFLSPIGLSEGELVRATGRLASALRERRAGALTVTPVTTELLAYLWGEITEEVKRGA